MSEHIKQFFDADCAVASLAMFLGVPYEYVARHCSGYELVHSGFARSREIAALFGVELAVLDISIVDRSAPAILSVPSLNEGGTHAIYWDGKRIYDPQHGRPGKACYSNQAAWEHAFLGYQAKARKGDAHE